MKKFTSLGHLMNNKYLFVFEGKAEDVYFKGIEKHLLGVLPVSKCIFGADVYELYRQMTKYESDGFIVDLFTVLKSQSQNSAAVLEGMTNDDFAGIFLFFDYDSHVSAANKQLPGDDKILEMLEYFDNDTENGLMLISYPMLEALRHYHGFEEFRDLIVKCKRNNCHKFNLCPKAEHCIKEPHYKELSVIDSLSYMSNLNKYTDSIWQELMCAHLSKIAFLIDGEYSFPRRMYFQKEIFEAQLDKYISLECPHVSVLSSFPAFLLYYWGLDNTKKRIIDNSKKEI